MSNTVFIEVQRLSDMPDEWAAGCVMRTMGEVREWAARKEARQVWYFVSNGKIPFYTAMMRKAEEKHE